MRILYFGIYDPEYSRNRVLIEGLRENGAEVVECREIAGSSWKYLKLTQKYLKLRNKFDIMVVGFPGQEVVFLAKILTRKPIVFDAFTSHYGGYILDRQYFSKKSWRAKYYRFLDTWSCKLADMVLLDTDAHIDFFVKEFGLRREKFKRIFVGTDSKVFYPREIKKDTDNFLVHFHGNYIPLQGVEYIIRAAKLLEKENISFNLTGQGQTYKKDRQLAEKLGIKNINFIDRVSYKELADYMTKADVCLGIFGDTPKTNLVIPNKVFEALACKKPVITADTPAIRELISDNEALLVKASDPEALAEGILRLKEDPVERDKVAEKGYDVFCRTSTPGILGSKLVEIIKELSHHVSR